MEMSERNLWVGRIFLASAFLGVLAGCANIAAVNSSASELASASGTWDAVAGDFQGTCSRRNLMTDTPSDCAQEARATSSIEATDKILNAYFTALVEASTTSNFSVEPGISAVASAVDGLPGADTPKVDAVKGLASFLAGLATRGIEERTIKRLVVDGAPKAEDTLNVLSEIVVPELSKRYDDEKRLTRLAFTSYALSSGAPAKLEDVQCAGLSVRGLSTGTVFLLAQAYCTRILALDEKRAALTSYKSSLFKATQTLKSLEEGKDNLDAKALAKQLRSDASDLKKDLEAIEKAF